MIGTVVRLAMGVGVATTCGGCALAPVAALGVLGNVSDIGSTAFTAGTEVFSSGKLETVEFTAFDQAQRAVRSMANDLRLHTRTIEADKIDARFDLVDDGNDKARIDIHRRTAAVCTIRIDVGWFGSESYARLLLKSVRHRLPDAASPAHGTGSPVDLRTPRTYQGLKEGE